MRLYVEVSLGQDVDDLGVVLGPEPVESLPDQHEEVVVEEILGDGVVFVGELEDLGDYIGRHFSNVHGYVVN